jgi:hypothetical protein
LSARSRTSTRDEAGAIASRYDVKHEGRRGHNPTTEAFATVK